MTIETDEFHMYGHDWETAFAPTRYPDGVPMMGDLPFGNPHTLILRPKTLANFMAAMFWADGMRFRNRELPHLILPFVPGARQDRLNDQGDFLFTAKSIANEINARGFPRVTVLDPHSEVTSALVDRCRVVHAADCIRTPPGKYSAVLSPDAGAEKRAGRLARKLGVPLVHGWKKRDLSTGKLSGFGVEGLGEFPPDHARVLVVDDICDGGGTFVGLAETVKEQRGDIDLHLWVTHGLFTQGTAKLRDHYSHVYCTDSVLGAPRDGVIEIKVCEAMMKGTLGT